MSLRERLEAKSRRRTVVSVVVVDATEATAAADTSRIRWAQASGSWGDEDERTQERWAALQAAEAAVAECYEQVEFQACKPIDFEAIQDEAFPREGDTDPAKVTAAIPELAALCAVDEELRDPAWWAEQLTDGRWSFGEKLNLWTSLLRLNSSVPEGRTPFV